MEAAPGLIVSGVNFNYFCCVHNHRFCLLQVWCPTVFASSVHCVFLKFGLQDILFFKVLKECATLILSTMDTGSVVSTSK